MWYVIIINSLMDLLQHEFFFLPVYESCLQIKTRFGETRRIVYGAIEKKKVLLRDMFHLGVRSRPHLSTFRSGPYPHIT